MFRLLLFIIIIFFSSAKADIYAVKKLSLHDAILLAVRENPNIKTAQLSHVQQVYAVEIEEWQFHPHFVINATRTTSKNYSVTENGYVTANATGINPQASLLTPIGTQLTLAATNNVTNNYNPGVSLQIMQPLLRGFGRPIVEAALNNAIDSEKISCLNLEGQLRTTVTAVINAYLDVMSAQNILAIDQQALQRAEDSVRQTKLFIKAGQKAGVELVTVEADAAVAETKIENDKNNLDQARYALLTTIGINPNTQVILTNVDVLTLINKYHLPTLDESKNMGLTNDIQYQVDQITFQGAIKRSILAAEDNTRWQLNLTLNTATGNGTGGGPNAGLNSLVNGVNQTNSAALNLTIPIDDRPAKVAVATAKIAEKEAAIALEQERWSKETNVINGWNSINSALRARHFAENAEKLQEKTYHISFQKYSFGLIDSLELQSATQRFSSAQQTLLDAEIAYLKALMNLDLLTGMTLKTWNVEVNL